MDLEVLMRKSRFSEFQMVATLEQVDARVKVPDVCRHTGTLFAQLAERGERVPGCAREEFAVAASRRRLRR